MKIEYLDVLKKSAQLLNKDELALFLNDGYNSTFTASESELIQEQQTLTYCMFEAYSEIATDYFPVYHTETIQVANNTFNLTTLNKKFKSVKYILDSNNNKVENYEIEYDNLIIDDGTYVIKYRYIPMYFETALNRMQNFDGKISESVLSFGTCAFYCLKYNLSDSYHIWDTKFKQSLQIAMQKTENLYIKPRRFF